VRRFLPRKLDWYSLREMIGPFCTWMIALLILILGNFLFLLLKAAKAKHLPALQIALFMGFRLPFSIVLAIPMSYLFACCLAISRMASEGEVTAMQVAGVSPWRVLAPYIVAGLATSAAAFGVNELVVPWANHLSQNSLKQAFVAQSQLLPEANVFIEGPRGFMFYSERVDVKADLMYDTVVFWPGTTGYPEVWVADQARFDDNRVYMTDVRMFTFGTDGQIQRCGFAASQMMDLKEIVDAFYTSQRSPEEESFRQLLQNIRDARATGQPTKRQEFELHSKVAIPCATLVFVTLGAPLALRFGRRGGFAGTVIALTMIFIYYCFMSWGKVLGLAGRVDPFWGAWAQNVAFFVLGLLILWRVR